MPRITRNRLQRRTFHVLSRSLLPATTSGGSFLIVDAFTPGNVTTGFTGMKGSFIQSIGRLVFLLFGLYILLVLIMGWMESTSVTDKTIETINFPTGEILKNYSALHSSTTSNGRYNLLYFQQTSSAGKRDRYIFDGKV